MNTEILTLREVAEYLRLTEKTTYRYALEGTIPGFKIGGTWRFRKRVIDQWIQKQEKGAA